MRPHCGSSKRVLFQWKARNKELKVCGWKRGMLNCIGRSYSYYALQPLAAACSKIARASVEVAKTRLFSLVVLLAKKRMLEQAFSWSLIGWEMIWNCWGSLRWDDWSRRYKGSECYCTACKCCLSKTVNLLITKISHFWNQHDSSLGRNVNNTLHKSLEIQA